MLPILRSRQRKLARTLQRADQLRDNKQFAEAAKLYETALHLAPQRADLYVQYGNMLKDSGQLAPAVRAYENAHNSFIAQAAQRGLDHTREAVGDIYLQLGHAFKLAGARDFAIEFYRRANTLKPIPQIQEELKIAELTSHGVSENMVEIAFPQLDHLPGLPVSDGVRVEDFESAFIADACQCLCWSKNHFVDASQTGPGSKLVTCGDCGTMYSQDVVKMNIKGLSRLLHAVEVSAADLEALLSKWPIELRLGRIGLIGAQLSDKISAKFPNVETIPAYNNRLHPGIERCSFDAIVIWTISYALTHVRRVVDQAHQALRPNGLLVVGYTPSSALPLVMQGLRDKCMVRDETDGARIEPVGREAVAKVPADRSPMFLLSDLALRAVLEPVRREGRLFPVRYRQSASHHFLAMQKSGVMSVGIMSGIGDAVWSLVIQKAVRRKYGADALLYHINDSGDGRRKRSNNMLARFGFVDDMVTSKFQVHADTPMDDRSGHLNYIPSGPVAIDGRDEFDYRLIVNTYLEHGQGYDRVCEALGLKEEDLDFDFFIDYHEKPEDMAAVNKILNHVGFDYAVFYYGAEVDNTIGGLNRDEIWKPEDWNRLGRMVHEEFGLKIVVIGAPYDTSYANRILGANSDTFYYNAIGELDITETLALIQRSKFVVAFPAGVGIVGPYMRVPTVIFWRPKHMSYHVMHDRAGFCPKFATNWVPEPVIKGGGYYPAWYGEDTPNSIMEAVRKGGWAKRAITSPIGNWKE